MISPSVYTNEKLQTTFGCINAKSLIVVSNWLSINTCKFNETVIYTLKMQVICRDLMMYKIHRKGKTSKCNKVLN